jgi:hypothetical protein
MIDMAERIKRGNETHPMASVRSTNDVLGWMKRIMSGWVGECRAWGVGGGLGSGVYSA